MNANPRQLLRRIRILLGIMIAGLVVSGVTAFPLLYEIDLLHGWLAGAPIPTGVTAWIGKVHEGLHATHRAYPFLAYGTDWLAFGHLVIAIFFIGPFIDPVRNIWVVRAGQIACLLVIPVALICGAIREIPLWWRLLDSAFGVVGLVPLCLAVRLIRRLEAEANDLK
jgi:hypothetical protein